ncbi:MAG: PAS domain-containing protein, partial [Oryzomonas sp.]|uniref:PAS domain-containing protein n=1 Tax=Oryzomonas sp. TaxID=2855186 RepID=UPI00284A2C77
MNQAHNSLLRSLFESSPDACLLIENNRFIKCNQAAVAMLSADSKDQVYNSHPSEISPPVQPDGRNSHEKAEELLTQLNTAGSLRFEWMHKRRNGEPFHVDVSLTLLRDGDRNLIYTVWHDIAGL